MVYPLYEELIAGIKTYHDFMKRDVVAPVRKAPRFCKNKDLFPNLNSSRAARLVGEDFG
jgi:hypothetical protein